MFIATRGNQANSKAALAATEDRAREIVTAAHPCTGWVGVSTTSIEVRMHLNTGREVSGIITAEDGRSVEYDFDPDGVHSVAEKLLISAWVAEEDERRASVSTPTIGESLALADLED